MSARTSVTVFVTGVPAHPLTFEGWGAGKTYRVTSVTGQFVFGSGNWSKPRWKGYGRLIKKDGSLGVAGSQAHYDFEPDAETQRQFLATARKQVRAAADVSIEATK